MKTTTLMLPETTNTNWADVGRILAIVMPIFLAILHFINKVFGDRAQEREVKKKEREAQIEKEKTDQIALISSVAKETAKETVKETLGQYIAPLEKEIQEVKHGLSEVHKRIDTISDNHR